MVNLYSSRASAVNAQSRAHSLRYGHTARIAARDTLPALDSDYGAAAVVSGSAVSDRS